MVHSQSHTFKMGSMIALVLVYFLVELIAGHMLNSITLIADSFHMLSDFIALIIGIAARRIGKWPKSSKNTFGWQRAEVMGTLVNTVMLTTLTFTILIESIQRFIKPEPIEKPDILLYVGSGGLAVNVIGLIILGHHGHSHEPETQALIKNPDDELDDDERIEGMQSPGDGDVALSPPQEQQEHHGHNHSKKNSSHMNLRAVFLHVLADFCGSIAVVTSALILWLVPNSSPGTHDHWKLMIDPIISILMVVLILVSTIPLLKKSGLILLQSVPKDISVKDLKDKMENIEGIEKIHDLHVWVLQSDVLIGTVHIRCSNENYVTVSKKVKNLFHDFRIHCTTIQPEFDEHAEDSNSNNSDVKDCVLHCDIDTNKGSNNPICNAKQSCCPIKTPLPSNNNNNNKVTEQPVALLNTETDSLILSPPNNSSAPRQSVEDVRIV